MKNDKIFVRLCLKILFSCTAPSTLKTYVRMHYRACMSDNGVTEGLFRSTLFLQTFAAHLRATKGAQKILGLHGPNKAAPAAIGALGLVAASVIIISRPREVVLIMFSRWRGH